MGKKNPAQPCGTRLYRIWSGMKSRCYDTNIKPYKRYGGRGITVCDEWLNNFAAFEEWAYNNGYREYLTIERMDNDKGYTPNNCRWATQSEQMRNTSKTTFCTINGITKSVSDWADISGLKANTVYDRFRKGDQNEDIIRPIGTRPRQGYPCTMIEIDGITKSARQWSEDVGLARSTVLYRYRKGDRGKALIRQSRNVNQKRKEIAPPFKVNNLNP